MATKPMPTTTKPETRGRKPSGTNGSPKRFYIDSEFTKAKLYAMARKAGITCARPGSRVVNLALHRLDKSL